MPGPTNFSPILGSRPLLLGGVEVAEQGWSKTPVTRRQVLESVTGRRTIWRPVREADQTNDLTRRRWSIPFSAVSESAWWQLMELSRAGPTTLVDFDVEIAIFEATNQTPTVLTLAPPDAGLSLVPVPPNENQRVALVNGLSKDVIYSGTPGADEVRIEGAACEPGTALVPGDRLVVRYFGLYSVQIIAGSLNFSDFNRLDAAVEIEEVGDA